MTAHPKCLLSREISASRLCTVCYRQGKLSGSEKEFEMARRGTTARIDPVELEKLCAMQATDEEIAAWFGVSTRTIERRRKVRRFADVMDRGRARGRVSVRRMQMKLLEAGNATMGVWLGKQYLGQTDQIDHRAAFSLHTILNIPRDADPIGSSGVLEAVDMNRLPGTVRGLRCDEAIDAGSESLANPVSRSTGSFALRPASSCGDIIESLLQTSRAATADEMVDDSDTDN
jgi:hypothetical protein